MPVLSLKQHFMNGIRPDSDSGRDLPYCVELQNLRPHRKNGLRQFSFPVDPFTGSQTPSWPFPNLFLGNADNLIGASTTLKRVTINSGIWTAAAFNMVDKDAAVVTTVSPGGVWHFADFYTTWMAFNGVSSVFSTNWRTMPYYNATVSISTGAAYNESQPFMGGFTPSTMFSVADWPTFLSAYMANVPDEIAALNITGGADMNWVWWGTVGGGDLMWLFDMAINKYGSEDVTPDMGYGDDFLTSPALTGFDNYYMWDLMRRNEAGMRPMPWQGKITGMKQLGRHMMVYGALASGGGSVQKPGGIAGLNPSQNFWGMDFVRQLPEKVGIAGRGAFAGDLEKHLIWDEMDNLWMIGADLQAERLRYSHLISGLSGEPLITYDPHEKEFYISDGVDTIMLNENGVSKPPFHPTTIAICQGGLVGLKVTEVETPLAVVVLTDKITAKDGAQSVLEWVKVIGLNKAGATGWQLYVDWRTDSKETWTRTSAFTPDDNGHVDLGIPFLEYRVYLTSTNRPDVRLDDILVSDNVDGVYKLRYLLDASTPGAASE